MRTPWWRPQSTAAWTWEALVGVTIHFGRTELGARNLGFLMDDSRTVVNEVELGVNRSWLGMDAERHLRKSSVARAGTRQQRKHKTSTTGALETVVAIGTSASLLACTMWSAALVLYCGVSSDA